MGGAAFTEHPYLAPVLASSLLSCLTSLSLHYEPGTLLGGWNRALFDFSFPAQYLTRNKYSINALRMHGNTLRELL